MRSAPARVPVTRMGRHGDVGGVLIGQAAQQGRRIDTILQQACSNGVLRLANRNLAQLPREVFFLHEMEYSDKRWWEEQSLSTMDISHNALVTIELPPTENGVDPLQQFAAFVSLRLINASYNKLIDFPAVLISVCATTLTKLDLSHNELRNETCSLFTPQQSTPRNRLLLHHVVELDVSFNKLSSVVNICSICPMLEKLNVSNNALCQWVEDNERPLPTLRHLQISNNQLTSLLWWPRASLSQMFPNLEHLDASCNALSVEGFCRQGRPSSDALPPKLVTVNFKRNRLTCLPWIAPSSSLPCLREAYFGNNSMQQGGPDENSESFSLFQRTPSLEILDLSNNRLKDISFLLPLRRVLARLDVQNNDITVLPPEFGLFERLHAFVLAGNPLRSIRSDLLQRPTPDLLKFLKGRLPTDTDLRSAPLESKVGSVDAALLQSVSGGVGSGSVSTVAGRPPSASSTSSTSLYAYASKAVPSSVHSSCPFATELNAARPSEAMQAVDAQCRRLGDHNGTTWDVSYYGPTAAGVSSLRPAPSRSDQGSSARQPHSIAARSAQQGAGVLLDTSRLDGCAAIAELHAATEARFRESVRAIALENQRHIEVIALDFLAPFPSLRELRCCHCSSLAAFDATSILPHPGSSRNVAALSCLSTVDLTDCRFTAASLNHFFEAAAVLQVPLSRVVLTSNKSMECVPSALQRIAPVLQYLRLDQNPQLGGQQSIATVQALGGLCGLLELALNGCNLTALPADLDGDSDPGWYEQCWPKLQTWDVSCNALTNVPFSIGRMKRHLRTFSIEGNAVRWLRGDIVARGTVAVLQYLEDRIPAVGVRK